MNLKDYDLVVISTSGGKDSLAMMSHVVGMAKGQGYPLEKLHAFHADLGTMEWPGTKELVREQCRHFGLELRIGKYRDRDGENPDLLEYVQRRRKKLLADGRPDAPAWPSSAARFCTSEFKRAPGGRNITALHREVLGGASGVRILNAFGFRSEESPARAKRPVTAENKKLTTGKREVTDWLPIHDWDERAVWAEIKRTGARHHSAYDLGMPRLSCVFCIFAPKPALMIAGKANPELLDRYVAVEDEVGSDFRQGQPLRDIKEALARGEAGKPSEMGGDWNM